MAKCKLCGRETGDHIEMCRKCAEEIFFEAEKQCYCCGQAATKKLYEYNLCDECYQLHVTNNARAVDWLKKQRKAGMA